MARRWSSSGAGRDSSSSKNSTAPRRYGRSSLSRTISNRRRPRVRMSRRPSGYWRSTLSTVAVQPVFTIPFSLASTTPNSSRSRSTSDHFLVAVLEDVERKLRAGQQHGLEREKRQKSLLHATIMAFAHLFCAFHDPQAQTDAGHLSCRIHGLRQIDRGPGAGRGARLEVF